MNDRLDDELNRQLGHAEDALRAVRCAADHPGIPTLALARTVVAIAEVVDRLCGLEDALLAEVSDYIPEESLPTEVSAP